MLWRGKEQAADTMGDQKDHPSLSSRPLVKGGADKKKRRIKGWDGGTTKRKKKTAGNPPPPPHGRTAILDCTPDRGISHHDQNMGPFKEQKGLNQAKTGVCKGRLETRGIVGGDRGRGHGQNVLIDSRNRTGDRRFDD